MERKRSKITDYSKVFISKARTCVVRYIGGGTCLLVQDELCFMHGRASIAASIDGQIRLKTTRKEKNQSQSEITITFAWFLETDQRSLLHTVFLKRPT